MHGKTLADLPATAARQGGPVQLAEMLRASRADTLASFATYQPALPDLRVPLRPELNLPLWELGHIGWFQGWWTTRYTGWREGWQANPDLPRTTALRADADALYDSSTVSHPSRWQLPLPDAHTTQTELAQQLEATLVMLAQVDPLTDATLYCFRLVLLHEDMHHEAALYMAQGLGIPLADARWQQRPLPAPPRALHIEGGAISLGREANAPGFAFDNECGQRVEQVAPFAIDAQSLRWDEFLPWVEAGYGERRWWSDAGWQWRLGRDGALHARRQALLRQAQPGYAVACISAHEAQAWCNWAGRRLPTEAEWCQAQRQAGPAFRWGDVWEWTASRFAPFEGFLPHPYRDYSAPWFDGRPVLKGASYLTQPRLIDPLYRNYFPAARCDVPAGLRSVAL